MTATLPADIGTCAVYGTYIDLDGNPIAGSVSFIPRPVMLLDFVDTAVPPAPPDPGTGIVAIPKQVDLDAAGHFAITLPATDDPEISPLRWTYQVKENFAGGRTYDIEAPQEGAVDLIRASPVPNSTGTPIVRGPRGLAGAVQTVQGRPVDTAGNVDLEGTVLLVDTVLGEIADADGAQRAVPSGAGTHQISARENIGAVGWTDTGTMTDKTISGGHYTGGGSLAGTFAGAPTLSGAVVFSDGPQFTGNPKFEGNPVFSGTPTFSANPQFTGDPDFAGDPTFDGQPIFPGQPRFPGVSLFSGVISVTGDALFTGESVTLDGPKFQVTNNGVIMGNVAAVLVAYGGQFANDQAGDHWWILNGGHGETLSSPVDTNDLVNTNNGRITIPARLAGHWLVAAQASFAVSPRVALGQVAIFLNGNANLLGNITVGVEQFRNSTWEPMANNADVWAGIQGNASYVNARIVDLAAGDYLQLAVHGCGDGGNYGLATGTGQRTVLTATPI